MPIGVYVRKSKLSPEEVRRRKNACTNRWRASHKEEYRASNRLSCKKARDAWKLVAYEKLGNRCSSKNCLWINSDNTYGCTDSRCLQIDHVLGGGHLERISGNLKDGRKFYKKIFEDTENRYQLLCANCNWIKRYQEGSTGGRKRSSTIPTSSTI